MSLDDRILLLGDQIKTDPNDLLLKQQLFPLLVSKLINYIYTYEDGNYSITFGEAYRTIQQAALNAKSGSGISNSLHTKRLAIDINLFKGNTWLKQTSDHKPFGDYWKSLYVLNRWGGDFKTNPDSNHYSIEHQGIR